MDFFFSSFRDDKKGDLDQHHPIRDASNFCISFLNLGEDIFIYEKLITRKMDDHEIMKTVEKLFEK